MEIWFLLVVGQTFRSLWVVWSNLRFKLWPAGNFGSPRFAVFVLHGVHVAVTLGSEKLLVNYKTSNRKVVGKLKPSIE